MPINAQDIFGIGLTRSKKLQKSFLGSIKFGAFGLVQDVSLIGFQASKAGPGGFVPAVIGQSAAIAAGFPIAGFAAMGLSLIPGVGPAAAAVLGGLLAVYAELRLGSAISDKVRWFTDIGRRVRHLEMGGNYQDTLTAQRQRMRAIQDMNASLIPGRRYLGQEALLMHR